MLEYVIPYGNKGSLHLITSAKVGTSPWMGFSRLDPFLDVFWDFLGLF